MLNLILKDILIQKRAILIGFLYIIFFVLIFPEKLGSAILAIALVTINYILVASSSASEDKTNSHILLNSLPISRRNIVLAKYLSLIVYSTIGIVAYMIIDMVAEIVNLPIEVHPVSLEGIVYGLFAVGLFNGIYLPILFKLGYIKSKAVHFLLFFTFFGSASYVVNFFKERMSPAAVENIVAFFMERSDLQIGLLLLGITFVMLLISYSLSLSFYKKREF